MYSFETITKEQNVQKRIEAAMNVLLETDIVESGNVISFFEDEVWLSERNYFKKLLEYKTSRGFYGDADCDVSILSMAMYCLLYEYLTSQDVFLQYGSKVKYELKKGNRRFKGDTLTSAITSIKLYLGYLWKEIDENKIKYSRTKFEDFYNIFSGVATTGVPCAKEGGWMKWCANNSSLIWDVMADEVKDFLCAYNDFGNYICIPGESYALGERKYTSFNMSRSCFGKKDSVDALLLGFYRYFSTNNILLLEKLFSQKSKEIAIETINWLFEFHINSWENFIKMNCLEDFVDPNSMIPISMKTGEPITINDEYNPMPESLEECSTYFSQLSTRIKLRNTRINQHIKEIKTWN